eukprot:9475259-Ditylum_brightwellii.AAC.1
MGLTTDLHKLQLHALCSLLAPGDINLLLAYVDIYVDDFIVLAQGPRPLCDCLCCHLFQCIDLVSCPNDSSDTYRQEPNSIKKLCCGDVFWTTQKKVLGWIVNTI